MWSLNRRFAKGMQYVLVPVILVSLIIPSLALLFAQEAPAENTEESSTSSPDEATTETPQTSEELDFSPLPESLDSEIDVKDPDKGEEEEPPESSLLLSAGDLFHDDEKKAVNEKLRFEPEPLNGSLHYSYPLTIPLGRNGLEPAMSLVYSSQPTADASIVGYGWDVPIPYISVSTVGV